LYFARSATKGNTNYLAVLNYEENIACYPATSFAATGNLRAFIAGRISHSLGWTGPSITLDTACSSSAVAVHQACKTILSAECVSALAGGVVSIMSYFFLHWS